jgi:Zn-dependent M28 family amino/carboxypeptidase
LFSKALNARAHGAVAIVYVNDTAAHGADTLDAFVSLPGPADPGIPFVQVGSAHVEAWFAAAGRQFKDAQQEIDRTLTPQSFAFAETLQVAFEADVRHTSRNVSNVVGYLPGVTDEYVIVGAHYDHLGLGEQYSLAPEKAGAIHPGADDNASGVAGVLALARYFGAHQKPIRGIVFIAFAGEELGLLGSVHYANHPLLPTHNARLMINMDMIGRIRESKVMVGGAPAGSELRDVLDRLGLKHKLDLDLSDTSVYGSSDHTSFKSKRIQTLFFFSGLHGDYHRPSDTWEKIDAPATVRLLHLIADLLAVVTTPASKSQFAAGDHSMRILFRSASINSDEAAIMPITIPQECGESAKGMCFRFMPYTPLITSAGVATVPKTVNTFIA